MGGYLHHHPSLPGLNSIDNEYLLMHLAQGQIGCLIFLLDSRSECADSVYAIMGNCASKTDRAFVVCLLAAMSVFWLSVYTVYMGEQLPQIAFLLIGWSQSALENSRNAAAPAKFSFKRVYS